jgi:hypothetical protein
MGASIEKAPLQTFAMPRAALQAGLEGFRSVNATSAIEALKYAYQWGEVGSDGHNSSRAVRGLYQPP